MQNNPSVQKAARNEMRKAERRRGGGEEGGDNVCR